ncbi:hypothetical protein EBZ38_00145 [bacterium]|nr:hypothetical protein [bacterium]
MPDQLPITIKLEKRNNQLVVSNELGKAKLDLFIKGLSDGEQVSVTYEVASKTGNYAQMSKLHKCIRELANYTGDSFEDMKLQVKIRSGLCIDNDCRSFAECSIQELSLAIQAAIEIGDIVGFNLH